MRPRRYNSVLSECLDLMRAGASIDQCLSRYPRMADRLRPALTLADKVSRTPLVPARPQARDKAWQLVSSRTAELRAGKRPLALPKVRMSYGWLRPAGVAASFLLAFAIAGGGVVYASQDALPDSPLYRVKLASEEARLWFVFDETHEAEILLDQSNERIDEITATVRQGDSVPENALSALHNRNERAVNIMLDHPEDTGLRARVLTQAQAQEDLLLALWPEVTDDALPRYTEAVAQLHNTRLGGGAGTAFVSVRPEELAGGILSISGQAEQLEDGVWRVGGVELRIDDRTIGHAEIKAGGSVSVLVARSSNARLHALSLSSLQTGPASTGIVSGAIEQVTDEGIVIAGQFIEYSDDTFETIRVKPGERVNVTVTNGAEGGPVAQSVAGIAQTLWFEGTIAGDVSLNTSMWNVGGLDFRITPSTTFDARGGPAADGARVQIEAVEVDGDLLARRVTVLASEDAADTASVLGTFAFDDNAGEWVISGIPMLPPSVDEDPPEGSLVFVDTRRVGSDFVPSGYTVIERPDQPALVQLQGTISGIDGSRWTLEIGQVRVNATAQVSGRPEAGKRVFVWGQQGPDGTLQATYALVLDDVSITQPAPEDEGGDDSGQ